VFERKSKVALTFVLLDPNLSSVVESIHLRNEKELESERESKTRW